MTEPNPYQTPDSPDQRLAAEPTRRSSAGTSLLMILAGIFFCVASFYALFGAGIEGFWTTYRSSNRFPFWFLLFYAFVSGLTSLGHLSYLVRGKPKQALAGMYAIGWAAGVTGVIVVVLEFLARR